MQTYFLEQSMCRRPDQAIDGAVVLHLAASGNEEDIAK